MGNLMSGVTAWGTYRRSFYKALLDEWLLKSNELKPFLPKEAEIVTPAKFQF